MTIQNITVVGAGAIGGWLATLLAQLPHVRVSVLARGSTLAAIQAHGLRLHTGGQVLKATVQASDKPQDLGPQDLVVLSVKSQSVRAVADQVAQLMSANTTLLCAMNGVPWWFAQALGAPWSSQALQSVDANGDIAARLPAANILGAVVHASCATSDKGVIHHHFGNGLIVGEAMGDMTDRVQAVQALFSQAGLAAKTSDRIAQDIWYKLWGNMTMNPISAITGATTDKILSDDLLRGFVSQVMLEAKAIGEKIGLPIDQQPEDRHQVTLKLGAFKTSMLQDVEAGRAVELDALLSSVRELGQWAKVPTPSVDALLGLARVHAQTRNLY